MPLPPRKKAEDALLLALACGATVETASRQCGLSERTIYRRLKEPDFQRKLRDVRADMLARTAAALTAAATEAVRTLLDLQKPGVQAAVRLGAARAILEIGLKLRENVDLEARIAALEDRQVTVVAPASLPPPAAAA
jgi:Homeodomain-like domain